MSETHHHASTHCVHTGTLADDVQGGMNSPIYPSTATDYKEGITYPRYFNAPNQTAIIRKLSALEHAEDGLLFSSGMAAISTAVLALLEPGDHIIFQQSIYGGTHKLATHLRERGIEVTWLARHRLVALEEEMRPNTRILYLESPSNPLLELVDIRDLADRARTRECLTMIDNTFASPINQQPIDLGIDLVLHSGTKYLGGHSDLCFGAALGTTALIDRLRNHALYLGGSVNAQTCYLIERSLKTLALRVERQNSNAFALAQLLEQQDTVRQVRYPGLASHPQQALAARQMKGFGGMVAFELADAAQADQCMQHLKLIQRAVSLGGVESTICSPAQTSHIALTHEERAETGITEGWLRLSVGIEDAGDLSQDLLQALAQMA